MGLAAITPKDVQLTPSWPRARTTTRCATCGSTCARPSMRRAGRASSRPTRRRQSNCRSQPRARTAQTLPGNLFPPSRWRHSWRLRLRAMTASKPVVTGGKDWQGAILFSFCTGARISDTANITWNAIGDLPAKVLSFRPKKTGRLVTIPIHPALETHLLDLSAPDSGKAFVFPAPRRQVTRHAGPEP